MFRFIECYWLLLPGTSWDKMRWRIEESLPPLCRSALLLAAGAGRSGRSSMQRHSDHSVCKAFLIRSDQRQKRLSHLKIRHDHEIHEWHCKFRSAFLNCTSLYQGSSQSQPVWLEHWALLGLSIIKYQDYHSWRSGSMGTHCESPCKPGRYGHAEWLARRLSLGGISEALCKLGLRSRPFA